MTRDKNNKIIDKAEFVELEPSLYVLRTFETKTGFC